jgi:hypothetical protein
LNAALFIAKNSAEATDEQVGDLQKLKVVVRLRVGLPVSSLAVIHLYVVGDVAIRAQVLLEPSNDAIPVDVPTEVLVAVKVDAANDDGVLFVEEEMQTAFEAHAKRRLNLCSVVQSARKRSVVVPYAEHDQLHTKRLAYAYDFPICDRLPFLLGVTCTFTDEYVFDPAFRFLNHCVDRELHHRAATLKSVAVALYFLE